MRISPVSTPAQSRQFLDLVKRIYAGDPNFIRPLDKDIEFAFDPKQNKFFKHGQCQRWLLLDEKGRAIGRVAAFINDRTAFEEDQPTGGMGFFECINDQEAANLLLDTARDWLTEHGMEAMDGPINFGERDAWWGLLVEGFEPPVYRMNYNPPYYQKLLETYGFRTYFKQFVFSRKIQDPVQQKFREKYDALMKDGHYSFEHLHKRAFKKHIDDFREIYNAAWGGHANFKKMTREQAFSIMKSLRPVLVRELAWFAYFNGKPIGFFIMIPDLNQIFKDYDGKLGLWEKLKTWFRCIPPPNPPCKFHFSFGAQFWGNNSPTRLTG